LIKKSLTMYIKKTLERYQTIDTQGFHFTSIIF